MNKNGYGNLSELITVARTRAEKGTYLVRPRDIANPGGELSHLRGMPDCQLILAPRYGVPYEELAKQAAWLLQNAPGRARIAMTLHYRANDEFQLAQMPRASRIPGRATKFPADGILLSVLACTRRSPAWRRGTVRRCQCQRLGGET